MNLFNILASPITIVLILAYIYLFGALIYYYIKSYIQFNSKNDVTVVDYKLQKTSYKPLVILVVIFILSIVPFAMLALGSGGETFFYELIFGILIFGPLFFSFAYVTIFYYKKILKKESTFLECAFFSFLLAFAIGFFILLFNNYLSLQFIPYSFHIGNSIISFIFEFFNYSINFNFIITKVGFLITLILVTVLNVYLFSILFFAIIDLREKEKRIESAIKITLWVVFFIIIEIFIHNIGFK